MKWMASRELEGLSVIVIEDDEDTRDVVRRLLETAGARVRAAGSAAEGMALFNAQRPDLLLVDIAMPGEDGLSFMRRLRSLGAEEGGQTPAAALTARAVLEDRLESLKWSPGDTVATLVVARLDWNRFSVGRFESWLLRRGREPELRVALEADSIDRGLDRAVDEFDDQHEKHRRDQHGSFEAATA